MICVLMTCNLLLVVESIAQIGGRRKKTGEAVLKEQGNKLERKI